MEKLTPYEWFHKHHKSLLNQGESTSEVFAGKYVFEATKELYAQSAPYISSIIEKLLPPMEPETLKYELTDLGSFKGELLSNIISRLPQYHFHTTAVDINEIALRENNADQKIVAELNKLPIKNLSQDVVTARYVLVWNTLTDQQRILSEIARITKGVAIIQHAGADSKNSDEWRYNLNKLLTGIDIPKLKREGHFFSSRQEVEEILNGLAIRYEKIKEKRIDNFSDVFIERYSLNENEKETMKRILDRKDYIFQTTWLIFPKNTVTIPT